MKSFTGKFTSVRGWALFLALLLGAGMMIPACGDEETPAPTTPAPPPPAPPPAPAPEPEPEPEAPAVPTGLRISASGMDFIEWSWTPVADVSGYDVQFSANEAFTDEDEIIARTAEEISYRREGLEAGTSAFLRVRSATGTGEERITSDWSTHVTGMTEAPTPAPEPPATPTGLEVSDRGSDFIEWSWDPVDGASGYDVQYSSNEIFSEEDEIIARTVEQVSYRRDGLDEETDAYLRVRAAAGTGEDRVTSDWSTHVTGMTLASAPPPPATPATPTGLVVSDTTENSITWTWDAVMGAQGYLVQISTDEMFEDMFEGDDSYSVVIGTSYTATDLEPETTLYVRVAAGVLKAATPSLDPEDYLLSPWTTHATGMTDAAVLSAPANLRVKGQGPSYIEWEWDEVDGADGYHVQHSGRAAITDADPAAFVRGGSNTTFRVALDADTDRYLRVRAYTGTLGDPSYGEWSDAVGGTTTEQQTVQLDAPTGLTADREDSDSITLEWDDVDNADSYEVEQRFANAGGNWNATDCDGSGSNTVEDTECVASDLNRGTDYEFRVRGIPADDTQYEDGEWAVVEASTTGRQQTTTPGGMGDLNVRWQNNGDDNSNIVFIWDRQGDAKYETAVLTPAGTTDVYKDDPCEDVADSSYGSATSATSQSVPTADSALGPGTIRGLCVRTEDSSETSFAWGISPPEEPNVPVLATGIDIEKLVTTALTWTDLDLKAGFDYTVNLASDPERPVADNKIQGLAATHRAVQSACEAGTEVDSFTPDINLDDLTVSVESGLKPHTGYLLCVRASNAAGASAWAVSVAGDPANDSTTAGYTNGTAADRIAVETYTRPAAPPRISLARTKTTDAVTTSGSEANEMLAPIWEIGTRDVDNVPREYVDSTGTFFNLTIYASLKSGAASLNVAACSTAPDATDYATIDDTPTDGISGFRIESADIERLAFTRKVYLCAQADSNNVATDDVDKGEGPWTISSVFSVTKPSGISASSPTAGDIEIKGWLKAWRTSYSYRYTYDDNGQTRTGTAYKCGSTVSAGTFTDTLVDPAPPDSGTAVASTSRTVTVWADDADFMCTDNTTTAPKGNSLTSSTVRLP